MSDLQVIVGLGATGLSCARYLTKLGFPIAVADTRAEPPGLKELLAIAPAVKTSFGSLDENFLANAARIILSPGVAKKTPAIAAQIKKGTPVIGDIELFAQGAHAPIISITGTNAKSTVTTLVGKMVEAAGFKTGVGGNLGIPALNLLDPKNNCYVLELSSFQLETTYSLKSAVASVLNVSPDHMDRYQDFNEYRETKLRIYQDCDIAVNNLDDPLTEYKGQAKKIYFSLQEEHPFVSETFHLRQINKENFLAFGDQILLPVAALPVKGKHYQANALAALAIGHGFGLPQTAMLEVLQTFPGLPHRCQFVRELAGVQWFNDSKGTNVGATLAAIEGLGSEINGKIVLIAGGVGKNADFSPLAPLLTKYVRHVILIGEAAADIACAVGKTTSTMRANSMQHAVELAQNVAQKNDSVLLSPACASFDMFKDFANRGDVFMQYVNAL